MPSLNSSMITAADYDDATQTLTVTFKAGQRYAYAGVPENEYEALVGASSPGRFFLSNIRDSYDSRQV